MFYGYTLYTTMEEDEEEKKQFEKAMKDDENDAKAKRNKKWQTC